MDKTVDYAAHQKQCGCSDPVGCIEVTREERKQRKAAREQLCKCSKPVPKVNTSTASFYCGTCQGKLEKVTITEIDENTWPDEKLANYCKCDDPTCIFMHEPGDLTVRHWKHDLPNAGRGYCQCEDPTCLLVHEIDEADSPAAAEFVDTSGGLIKKEEHLDDLMESEEESKQMVIGCSKCGNRTEGDFWPYDQAFYNNDGNVSVEGLDLRNPEEFLKTLGDTRIWCVPCDEEREVKIFGGQTDKPIVAVGPVTNEVPTTGLAKLPMDMEHICRKRIVKDVGEMWVCACGHMCKGADGATAHDGMGKKHYTNKKNGVWACNECAYETLSGEDAHKHDQIGRNVGTSSWTGKTCSHHPKELMKAKAGEGSWSIWAGKKWECESKLEEFDLAVNLTGYSAAKNKKHNIPVPELAKYAGGETPKGRCTEIVLDWPDGASVNQPREFWVDLIRHIKDNNLKTIMFCIGSHGRTGTALAAILITMAGYDPEAAIAWVRKHHCKDAIESWDQIDYLYSLAYLKRKNDKGAKPSKSYGSGNSTSSTGQTTLKLNGSTVHGFLPATSVTTIKNETTSAEAATVTSTGATSEEQLDEWYKAYAGLED